MKIHAIQHHPAENLGFVAKWIEQNCCELSLTHAYADETMPSPQNFDALILLGAPMGVYEEPDHPWMTKEKRLIESALKDNKKILGICFGSQILANVLGAKVYPHHQKEIGWFPIELTPDGMNSPLSHLGPEPFMAFHWHGDTFELPPQAKHLAFSSACANQAFSCGENILGLQFHPEISEEIIQNMAHDEKAELLLGTPFVQPEEKILEYFHYDEPAQQKIFAMLSDFFKAKA